MYQPDELKKDRQLWSPGSGPDIWALFQACVQGDLALAESLLQKDNSLAQASCDYRTPLFFAVKENRGELARLLLRHGASPISSGTSDTLLQIALDRGFIEMSDLLRKAIWGDEDFERGEAIASAIRAYDKEGVLELLRSDPGMVRVRDEGGNTPIHWATMTRQLQLVDRLLELGADIDAARKDGARPVQLCNGDYGYRGWRDVPGSVSVSPSEMFAHLKARGAFIDLGMACTTGDIQRVKMLLDTDPSVANRVDNYVSYYQGSGAPLKNAAARGHLEIVKLLLKHGADPNLREEGIAPYGHALYAAAQGGHLEIARLLLEHGAYPNPPVESSGDALSAALWSKNQEMADLLCSYGAARRVELLAYSNDLVTAAAVFSANPDLANDVNALENAAGEGHIDMVRLILRHCPGLARRIGVGVRSKGPGAAAKTREIEEMLFHDGMDPNFRNWLGITPLHRFAQRGELENAESFIHRGADLDAIDDELNSTPLGWAAKAGKTDMVRFLLERGANPRLPAGFPWARPASWAKRRGHTEILALLEAYRR